VRSFPSNSVERRFGLLYWILGILFTNFKELYSELSSCCHLTGAATTSLPANCGPRNWINFTAKIISQKDSDLC
jgi:hypothetical protein